MSKSMTLGFCAIQPRLPVMAVVASVGLLAPVASATDRYLELEPPRTRAVLGAGYDSVRRNFMPQQCLTFGAGRVTGAGGGDYHNFSRISSNQQLAEEMDLSASASFSIAMGAASFDLSTKAGFFQQTKTNFYKETVLATYSRVDPISFVDGDLRLKPEYAAMPALEFRQRCGDYVIIGEQTGREFYGTAQIEIRDEATANRLSVSLGMDFRYGAYSGAVDFEYLKKLQTANNGRSLEIRVKTSGGNTTTTTLADFERYYKDFPKSTAKGPVIRLIAVPYEEIVTDWPLTDPLAPLTAEDKLIKLSEVAWSLIALDTDAGFVLANSKLFAMGSTPAKRTERTDWLKTSQRWYQDQLGQLRSNATGCDTDWSSKCETLYSSWSRFDIAAEYENFPTRYVADCYSTAELRGRDISMAFGSVGPLRLTKGDTEMGGGPVSLVSTLTFGPDFSGGSSAGATELLGTLTVSAEETKADRTTFKITDKRSVFDLRRGLMTAPDRSFQQCAYQGTGVKATPAPAQTIQVGPIRVDVPGGYHGRIVDRSGSDPRGFVRFDQGTYGVLSSIQCMVDRDGREDNFIMCQNVDVRNVQLDLVNTEDLEADKWVKPKPRPTAISAIKVLPKALLGGPSMRAGSAALGGPSMRGLRGPAFSKALAPRAVTKSTGTPSCRAGLQSILIGGRAACAPALKGKAKGAGPDKGTAPTPTVPAVPSTPAGKPAFVKPSAVKPVAPLRRPMK